MELLEKLLIKIKNYRLKWKCKRHPTYNRHYEITKHFWLKKKYKRQQPHKMYNKVVTHTCIVLKALYKKNFKNDIKPGKLGEI